MSGTSVNHVTRVRHLPETIDMAMADGYTTTVLESPQVSKMGVVKNVRRHDDGKVSVMLSQVVTLEPSEHVVLHFVGLQEPPQEEHHDTDRQAAGS